jgi:hypothetical protein
MGPARRRVKFPRRESFRGGSVLPVSPALAKGRKAGAMELSGAGNLVMLVAVHAASIPSTACMRLSQNQRAWIRQSKVA